ncbi:MAG: LacI family DNA-binding transcriptional regulator [Lachnospiraceae bacterium]|nr:LacI family DNA-binding transcriptional regulator [Lachnospiraceae bacterium]
MTIYDIAKLAGVSASTVSRVANNKPGIKEETRKQIQALLDQYDYRPNETARGLVNQSSKMIGILITDIRYAHHVDIAYYIEKEMEKQGYCSLILNTGLSDEKKVQAIKMLSQRRVDGVILVGSTFQCDAVKDALASCFPKEPVVITNGYVNLPNVKGVLVDEKDGLAACVELMVRKGHKKLAFVLPNQTPSNLSKQKGFVAGMENLGWKREELWIYTAPTTLEDGKRVTEQILKEHPDVEGIIFGEDLSAVSGIRVLLDHKIAVPDQVAVIGVDNSRYCDICYPKLTSLNNKMVEMSFEAARILLDDLEGRKNPEKIMLFSNIVEREST